MSAARACLAVAAGLGLATLPFWHYAHVGGPGEPHVDHSARHGGQLAMVGDHHIEIARRRGKVEVYVSDAWRRPLRPQAAWIVFDGSTRVPLSWESDRLVAEDRAGAREIEAVVVLADGTRLAMGFDFSGPPP